MPSETLWCERGAERSELSRSRIAVYSFRLDREAAGGRSAAGGYCGVVTSGRDVISRVVGDWLPATVVTAQ